MLLLSLEICLLVPKPSRRRMHWITNNKSNFLYHGFVPYSNQSQLLANLWTRFSSYCYGSSSNQSWFWCKDLSCFYMTLVHSSICSYRFILWFSSISLQYILVKDMITRLSLWWIFYCNTMLCIPILRIQLLWFTVLVRSKFHS